MSVNRGLFQHGIMCHLWCSLSDVCCLGVPLAALTAYQALYEDIKLEAGQKVVIIGASGGVGTYAVQLAGAKGGLWGNIVVMEPSSS